MTLALVGPKAEVGQLVLGPAVVVPTDSTIRDAARTMARAGVSSVLVEGVEAIVTERDLAEAVADGLDVYGPVTSIAADRPVTIDAHTSVVDAAATMLNRGVRHLVVREGDQVGVVSLRSIMAVLLQALEPSVWLSGLRFSLSSSSELWLG